MTDTAAVIAAATQAAAGLRRVIQTDRYDETDWELTQRDMPKLEAAGEQLGQVNWTGPAVLADVFASLHKATPRLHDDETVARTHRVNRKVMAELMDDSSWRDLRTYTVGDPFGAGLAVATMTEQLRGLYERLAPAQDAADAAEAAQQALDEAEQAGAGDGLDDEAQASLERLRAEAQAAADRADQVADEAAPSIGRAVRLAAGEAAADAKDQAEAAAGWGIGPGDLAHVDPAERLRLAAQLNSPRFRRIAELVGRMRNLSFGDTSTRFDPGPDEIHDVVLGDDLARIVPSELVYLLDDNLEDLFWQRFAEQQLLTYELRSTRREAKGSIIYVEDNSGSMEGDRELWARATGLALLDIAIRQGRRFVAIVFSGAGSMRVFDFDPATRDTALMLDYAGTVIYGGTDFAGPLDRALSVLDVDAASGRCDGDIVFATDGEAGVSGEWLAGWHAARKRLGFTCYGLNIGGDAGATLSTICDGRVADVHRLVDGDDARDIFRSINKEARA